MAMIVGLKIVFIDFFLITPIIHLPVEKPKTVEFKPRFSAHNDDEAHPPQEMRPPSPSF